MYKGDYVLNINNLRQKLERVVNNDSVDEISFTWKKYHRILNINVYRIICRDYLGDHNVFHVIFKKDKETIESVTLSREITENIVERMIIWAKKVNEGITE